jgi:hypothetical protein
MALLSAAPAQGLVWNEVGAAGNLPASAQVTLGVGPLTQIAGSLDELTEVDMFQIWIEDPLGFSAATVSSSLSVPDPQLFLFDGSGLGVFMNDDADSGLSGSQSELPAGHPSGPPAAGLYYLAIGRFDNEPFSDSGRIFMDSIQTTGPADPGGQDPVTSWNDDVIGHPDFETLYQIDLTGARAAVPEPGTLAIVLSGLAGLSALRRRGGG